MLEFSNKQLTANREFEIKFRERLSRGTLIGIGYKIPRNLSDELIYVPSDI